MTGSAQSASARPSPDNSPPPAGTSDSPTGPRTTGAWPGAPSPGRRTRSPPRSRSTARPAGRSRPISPNPGAPARVFDEVERNVGWMSDEVRAEVLAGTPLGRLGSSQDTAHLVDFLCSPRGRWVNGQLLVSDGGFSRRTG
ncbi:enoyl-ACP reductase-like protein [Streptomyces sp. TLI_235]|nr:enoyl-ACP reductase-like protein [Streptomyces sp. TLI_235]